MGRPTEERKGKTIKLRITDEMYEDLEKRGSISSVVREMIEDGLNNVPHKDRVLNYRADEIVPQNSEKEKSESENYVPQKSKAEEEIIKMCQVSGISPERFYERVKELFEDGYIYIDGLTIKTKGKYDMSRIEEICHRNNLDVQDVIDKLVSRLTR